jgi:Fe-S cluster assembly protein SufD
MRKRDLSGVDHYAAAAPQGRADAVERLTTYGFPGFKDEDWYYTSTKKLLAKRYMPVVGAPRAHDVELPEGRRMVFVDGCFDAASSTEDARLATSAHNDVGSIVTEPLGFDALNAALWRDGASVVLGSSAEPLHIVHVSTGDGRLACVRHRVSVSAGANATVVEHYLGQGGDALTVAVTEIDVGPSAMLNHVVLQSAQPQSSHVHTIGVNVDADAQYAATSVQSGAGLSRTELRVALVGEGATANLAGLAVALDTEHVDHHILIDHAVPRCTSTQVFRSILDGHARSVFTGKVVVRKDAQGTDSEQSNRNLLLSDDAIANTRPQLEIYADDVKCAHGATIGKLDEDSLFYLRQRGLDPAQARALLMGAFAGEVVDGIQNEGARAFAAKLVSQRMQAAGGAA